MSASTSTPDAPSTSAAQKAPLNILSIGASRNIGYYASLKLLRTSPPSRTPFHLISSQSLTENGATVTFLLRNPSIFDTDTSIQPFISSGKAHIVKGDALVKEDVAKAWNEAISRDESAGRVDYLLFTLGMSCRYFIRLYGGF